MSDAEKRGMNAAISGFAHEHIAAGVLMKRYGNVSLVDLPLSPYDIVIVYKKERGEDIVRAQVKTAKFSISFTGGTRGGVDRTYKSGVKSYIQSTKTCDVVIGLHPHNDSYDLYFVPTILIEKLGQRSISLSKIDALKNNYEMLDNCKNAAFVISNAKRYGIIT
jgi:Zn-dependent M28 family amino/carboxypeptidase